MPVIVYSDEVLPGNPIEIIVSVPRDLFEIAKEWAEIEVNIKSADDFRKSFNKYIVDKGLWVSESKIITANRPTERGYIQNEPDFYLALTLARAIRGVPGHEYLTKFDELLRIKKGE